MGREKNSEYRNREHLTADEVAALLDAARLTGREKQSDRNYTLVLLMFRHGLRVVEAAGLEWKDIDLKAKTVYIKRAKGSESGTHSLQADEVEALARLERVAGVKQVFVNERGRSFLVESVDAVTAPGISRLIERLGQRAGLDIKVHAHMMRHSCGYYLANQGYDLRLIQDWLGHRNIQHTIRYTKLAADRFKTIQWG
ncbi:tyrosine-type recombinase/integrase [Leptolyngbya sp. FACHB-16]|uniref:tyrosine-type recombinase/integrase n=1 Tax=unclassified Leptolyngbya TaxID=2650499 RepID=UPI00168371E8|nr:tyrosine-type recombinase/integrase [Leptolyngbya sp. FACHB-16]MBD2156009.1 tyrosine-type recombinase/integrase [Leptolyngbya sp. FACHB-16]